MTGNRSTVPWGDSGEERIGGRDYLGTKGNLGGDGYVHYVDYENGFIGKCIHQTLPNCTLNMYLFYVNYPSKYY